MDAPEAFILESLQSCESTAVQEGKVIQVAKHPSEHVMQYWLKVASWASLIVVVSSSAM